MTAALSVCLLLAVVQDPHAPPPAPAAEAPPKVEAPLLKTLANQITIGGQARFRAEYRDPIAYNDPGATPKDEQHEDVDLLLERIRINLKFTLNDQIEVFFQPQDQRTWGDEASVLSDENNLDVHQAFVEVRAVLTPGLSLKVGRQELSYGDQRLVSPLDWSNIGRTWDAGKLRYQTPEFWVEGFWSVIKEVQGASDDQDFFGLYASYVAIKGFELDAYVFGRRLNDNLQPGETVAAGNNRRDFTPGLRLKGAAAGFDFTAEGMLQRGTNGQDDVQAWAAALTLGYTVDIDWKPRIGIEYTHASGDEDPADGDIQTFDPLFPFGHYYQGFADVFSFKNGRDLAVYLKVAPTPTLSIHLDVHAFRLDEETDAWYNFAGAVVRPAAPAADDEVGREIDLHARLAVGKHLKFWGGVSRFFAGDFVEDTAGTAGTDRDMTWAFVQASVDF